MKQRIKDFTLLVFACCCAGWGVWSQMQPGGSLHAQDGFERQFPGTGETGQALPKSEPKKILLRVPVEDGRKLLVFSALAYDDLTEITMIPLIEDNQVTGARLVSLDQDHTVRAAGDGLVLQLPGGSSAAVGPTFAVKSKDQRVVFAAQLLDPDKQKPPLADNTEPLDPLPKTQPPLVETPELPSADAAIQAILKPENAKKEKEDDE